MFKNTNKRSNIKCKTLSHTYIYITGFRKKWIPRILGRSTYKIVEKEVHSAICKTQVFENWSPEQRSQVEIALNSQRVD